MMFPVLKSIMTTKGRSVNPFYASMAKALKGLCLMGALLLGQNAFAQAKVIGEVRDDVGPLPGATAHVKGTELGAVADTAGVFVIENVSYGNHILIISFVGMESQELSIKIAKPVYRLKKPVVLGGGTMLDQVEVQARLDEGEEKAILLQKKSLNLAQVVSSDGIERLPDRNAAEALQRMPGVVMETDQGEGSSISFRGTPADWGAALVNGDRLPVANEEDEGRAMNFEVLPTSLIEYIKYNQNLSPQIEGDAIGGSANFITKYVPEDPTINVQAGLGANFKAQQPLWNGTLLMGRRFGSNKRWGLVGGGSIYQRNWATDNYEIFYSNNDNHNIERLELRKYNGERTTYGLHAKTDFRLNENHTFYALGFYGRQDDMEFNRKTMYNWVAGVGQSIVLQNIHNLMINDLSGFNVGGAHNFGDRLSFDWKVSRYESAFRYGPSGDNGGQPYGYNVIEYEKLVRFKDYLYLDENGNPTDEQNAYTRLKLLDIDSPIPGYGTPADNLQPQYEHIVPVKPEDTLFTHKKTYAELRKVYERDPIVVTADWHYNLNSRMKLHFGAKFRQKEGYRTYGLITWIRDPQKVNEAFLYNENELAAIPQLSNYLSEEGGNYQPYTETFMSDAGMQNWISTYSDKLLFLPFGSKTTEIYKQFIGSNYDYTEQVKAGYLSLEWELSQRASLDLGLRVEETQVEVNAARSEDSTYFNPNTGDVMVDSWLETDHIERKYLSVLPMANLNVKYGDESSLRAAITRAMRRPNFNEIKPGQPDIHYTHFHALYGNPDLRPTYSWNVDLTFQRYFGLHGLFSIGAYYKYVTDHIFVSFRSDDLNVSGVSNTYRPPGGIMSKEYKNAPYAHVGGFELSYQRKLDFLPWHFKYSSVSLNYSYTASAMKIHAREEMQDLPRQSGNVFNFRWSYERKKLGANIGLNYRDPYLVELNLIAVKDPQTGEPVVFNQSNDFDMYMGKSLGLDFSVSYDLTDKLNVYAEFNNLLNTPYVVYRGRRERPVQVEYYGIRALIGVKYQFLK